MATPTLLAISRDAGTVAGGSRLTFRGYNFTSDATLAVGGVQLTAVTFTDNTTMAGTTASSNTTGVVDVLLSQTGGTSKLTSGWEYMPSPTTTYASSNFDSGTTTAPFGSSGAVTLSQDFANSGQTSVKCEVSTTSSGAYVFVNVPNTPMALSNNSQGLHLRWFVLMPTPTLTSVSAGQIKLHLCRVGGTTPDWEMLGIGPQFSSNPRSSNGSCVGITSNTDNGILYHAGSTTGAYLFPNRFTEIWLYYLWHSANSAQVRCWIDGKAMYNLTSNTSYGNSQTTLTYQPQFGIAFQQALASSATLYVDDITVADGVNW